VKPHATLCSILLLTLAGNCPAILLGQDQGFRDLSINSAVEMATRNYPAIRAAKAHAGAAEAGIDLARTSYYPKVDLLWQENRATRNNVFGLLLPQSTIPSISGPVLGTTALGDSAWGSAGGMLVSWEPFDFGLRKANLQQAKARRNRASAEVEVTRLDAAASAADFFLVLAEAEATARSAQANVDRMLTFSGAVRALVDNQLRPGADASRSEAELAAARNDLIQAQLNVENARASLAESLGIAGASITIASNSLPDPPEELHLPEGKPEEHPLAEVQKAVLETVRAREQAAASSYYPHLNYQFALFGRGSVALVDGRIDPGNGLFPDVGNWATGISISFSALDIFAIHARRRAEKESEAAETARQDQVIQGLKAQEVKAKAALRAMQQIAANTPIRLQAARETFARSRARYDAGLGTVVDVADAQRLLAQAEAESAVAKLNIWRAFLAQARAQGDIRPFLDQAARTTAGRP
jgi:outer membrane protein